MPPESSAAPSSAANSGDLELLPIPKLISFLESSYRKTEYEEVSRILTSREEHTMASLKRQEAANTELQSRCRSLEYETSFLRPRCGDLEDRFRTGRACGSETDQALREEKRRSALLVARIEELEHAMRVGAEEKEEAEELRRRVDIMETQNLKLFQETLELRDKIESLEEGKDGNEGITLLRETLELREKVEPLGKGKDCKDGLRGSIICIGDSDDEKDVGDRNGCEVICLDGGNDFKVEENGCSFYVNGVSNRKRKRKYIPLSDSSCSS